ncbi:DUF4129 domain-containing protein [Christiangramia sabulilitoris]|uniref:DUF4129 domain-containing protein n=1 Tax=Christiangramia sabulilitoris TaxID=2583991 RepID=A0A550I6X4_9FLAO|nr:DUF4129 domain-containing protein [Christiangramia sabulilitoris]TRO66726.1 DUF4129 domain-containing protein [Christiangramia sabulilitoris]
MKKVLPVILFFLACGSFYSQVHDSLKVEQEILYDEAQGLVPLEFDAEKIAGYRDQKEFEYLESVENDSWWTRFKRWVSSKYHEFLNWLFGDYDPGTALSFFINILPFILLLILSGLIIWLFSRLNPGAKILSSPKESEVFLSEEEDLVRHEDLAALISIAVKEGSYRLAVRYYYLNELRKLDELHHITYEYQKTNKDYFDEIKNKGIRKHFSEITKLYEFIWYGSFAVSESDYRYIEKGFLRMEQVLNSKSHE